MAATTVIAVILVKSIMNINIFRKKSKKSSPKIEKTSVCVSHGGPVSPNMHHTNTTIPGIAPDITLGGGASRPFAQQASIALADHYEVVSRAKELYAQLHSPSRNPSHRRRNVRL